MALTAITSMELARSGGKYPAGKSKDNQKVDSAAAESNVRKRTDVVELKNEVTQANRSAQQSALGGGAEQLLGKIDLSA